MTSGAIQNGVPTNVLHLVMVSVSCPATPKSASLTMPVSDSRTFAAGRGVIGRGLKVGERGERRVVQLSALICDTLSKLRLRERREDRGERKSRKRRKRRIEMPRKAHRRCEKAG